MRLGIITDVHEAVDLLRQALSRLRACNVDQIVLVGDVFDHNVALAETVELLAAAGVVGVWGNHDLGFCVEPSDWMRQRFGGRILDFFATLRGCYEVADCHFSHAQAWMDPADIEHPWYLNGLPSEPDLWPRNFAATDQRVLFMGHYHRWLAITPEGPLLWRGEGPLRLDKEHRYLIVVHAVCDGWCAVYDTEAAILTPIALDLSTERSSEVPPPS